MSDGVTGNTPDFDSGKSRFEPWSDNLKISHQRDFFVNSYSLNRLQGEVGVRLTIDVKTLLQRQALTQDSWQ